MNKIDRVKLVMKFKYLYPNIVISSWQWDEDNNGIRIKGYILNEKKRKFVEVYFTHDEGQNYIREMKPIKKKVRRNNEQH